MRVYNERACKICGNVFSHYHYRAYYCSDSCRLKIRNESAKQWRTTNPSLALEKDRQGREKRKITGKAETYRKQRRSSKAGYVDRFLERARKEYPNTNLTRGYIESIFYDTCSVTGVPFDFNKANSTSFQNPYSPSIDRIDSNLPYQQGNIQIVISAVNFAKNAMSMTDFTRVWKDIVKHWAALTE